MPWTDSTWLCSQVKIPNYLLSIIEKYKAYGKTPTSKYGFRHTYYIHLTTPSPPNNCTLPCHTLRLTREQSFHPNSAACRGILPRITSLIKEGANLTYEETDIMIAPNSMMLEQISPIPTNVGLSRNDYESYVRTHQTITKSRVLSSSFANRALIFLHKPLLDALHMVSMSTINFPQLITILVFFLQKEKQPQDQLQIQSFVHYLR